MLDNGSMMAAVTDVDGTYVPEVPSTEQFDEGSSMGTVVTLAIRVMSGPVLTDCLR